MFKGGASNARVSLPTPGLIPTVLLHGRIPGWIAATCAAGLSNARCPTATALLTVGWISGRGDPQCHLRDLQGFTCRK